MEKINMNHKLNSDSKTYFLERRDCIFAVLSYLSYGTMIKFQFLSRDFYYNIIPKLLTTVSIRKPSNKEKNIHPVNIKNPDYIEEYYGRFSRVNSLMITSIEIGRTFIKILKLLIENNKSGIESLIFSNSYLEAPRNYDMYLDELLKEFLRLFQLLRLKNLEWNNNEQQETSVELFSQITDLENEEIFQSIQTLTLEHVQFEKVCKILLKCQNLKEFMIRYCSITLNLDKLFESLSSLKYLQKLTISEDIGKNFTNQFFSLLSNLKQVTHLKLSSCEVRTEEKVLICDFSHLEHIQLDKVTKIENFMELFIHKNLKSLEIDMCKIGENGIEMFKNFSCCQDLKVLSLTFNHYPTEFFENLIQKHLPNFSLESLNLGFNALSNSLFTLLVEAFSKYKHIYKTLRFLSLYKTNINFEKDQAKHSLVDLLKEFLENSTNPVKIILKDNIKILEVLHDLNELLEQANITKKGNISLLLGGVKLKKGEYNSQIKNLITDYGILIS
jgi:hypothetical protein